MRVFHCVCTAFDYGQMKVGFCYTLSETSIVRIRWLNLEGNDHCNLEQMNKATKSAYVFQTAFFIDSQI